MVLSENCISRSRGWKWSTVSTAATVQLVRKSTKHSSIASSVRLPCRFLCRKLTYKLSRSATSSSESVFVARCHQHLKYSCRRSLGDVPRNPVHSTLFRVSYHECSASYLGVLLRYLRMKEVDLTSQMGCGRTVCCVPLVQEIPRPGAMEVDAAPSVCLELHCSTTTRRRQTVAVRPAALASAEETAHVNASARPRTREQVCPSLALWRVQTCCPSHPEVPAYGQHRDVASASKTQQRSSNCSCQAHSSNSLSPRRG